MQKLKIGFIGIGVMGKSMADNLLKAGYEVMVYTRTKQKAENLYKRWFIDFEFPISNSSISNNKSRYIVGKSYKSNGGVFVLDQLTGLEVPLDWQFLSFETALNFKTGKLNSNASVDNGAYPFFTCSSETFKTDTYSFDTEAVLLAGNNASAIYPLKYYDGKFDVYQRTYVIQANENLNGKFLYYFLDSYVEKLREQSIGGVIKYIKLGNLTDAEIPLPNLATQQRIAAILDQADAIIQNNRAIVQKYDALTQSLFLDMFGDPVKNEKGWEKIKLGDLSQISSGSTPSRLNDNYFSGNIPWVKTGEVNGKIILDTEEKITKEALENSSCKLYPKGSLIIAMYGQGKTRGQIGFLGIDATTNQACAVIPPSEKINFNYLFQLLKLNYEDLRSLSEKFNIPYHCVSHEGLNRAEHEAKVLEVLAGYSVDYIVLAKYMRILSSEFVSHYEERMINIHHSFLPAFIGANPYKQAFARGVKIIGATAHFVNNNLDEGPIIAQDVIHVNHEMTWKDMQRAGRNVEKNVLSNALDLVFEERIFVHDNKTIIF